MIRTYLAEIEHFDIVGQTLSTLYVSSRKIPPFTPTDPDRPNQLYIPRIVDPGNFTRSIFSPRALFGQSAVNGGSIKLANSDGVLDNIMNDGFDGRSLRVLVANGTPALWSNYETVMLGTIDQAVFSFSDSSPSRVTFRVRDRQALVSKPIQTTRYLGNNVLPDGVEGVEDDLKGVVKPRCYGKVFNASPPLVNTSKLIYQVHDGQIESIVTVYDRGVSLTKGTDRGALSTLLSTNPVSGQWDFVLGSGAEGAYFRLGTAPSGSITADIEGDKFGGVYRTTVADIVATIALRDSVITDIDASAF